MSTTTHTSHWFSRESLEGPGADKLFAELGEHERLAEQVDTILRERDPELARQFSDSFGALVDAAQVAAVRGQGRMIRELLGGELMVTSGMEPWYPGGAPA